jgi:hypothetical protein
MSYFVKNGKIHKNPPQGGCNAQKGDLKVYTELPVGYEKCDKCFNLPR